MKPFGTLAHHWNGSFEQVKGFLISRKYNGWSALWDGGLTTGMKAKDVSWYDASKDKKEIFSTGLWSLGRSGKPKVHFAPDSFINALPKGIPVHGEIWFNDRLDLVKRIVGFKQYFKPMWKNFQFIAFSIKPYNLWSGLVELGYNPNTHDLYNYPLEKSLNILRKHENEIFKVIKTTKCNSMADFTRMKEISIKNKWEGLMFGNPVGMYELTRSWNNLKWKPTFETEACVHGYTEGEGKNKGKVGSLDVSLVWDEKVMSVTGGSVEFVNQEVLFNIGNLRDNEREWEDCKRIYPVGSWVNFQYLGVSTHGVPQSPNLTRG